MPDKDDNLLSLTGIISQGSEVLFDRSAIAPGYHLRWSFLPELGFPSGGFRVERRLYHGEFQQPGSWEILTPQPLTLPRLSGQESTRQLADILRTLFSRVGTSTSAEFIEHYRTNADELVALLGNLSNSGDYSSAVSPGSRRPSLNLSTQDLLLLASLDPYIARILGFYFIDSSVLPGSPVDYQVIGVWGDTRWPRHTVQFDAVTPAEVSTGHFGAGELQIFSSLAVSSIKDGNSRVLKLEGVGGALLRILFPYSVMEVNLKFSRADGATEWRVRATNDAGQEVTRVLTAIPNERRLEIRSTQAFKLIDISPLSQPKTSDILSISYRRISGRIGEIPSKIIRFNPLSGVSIPESAEDVWVMPTSTSLLRQQIEKLRKVSVSPSLNTNGEVITGVTGVEILRRPQAAAGNTPDPARLVKLHVGYDQIGLSSPIRDVLTAAEPSPWPMPELIAFWRLSNLRAANRTLPLVIPPTLTTQVRFDSPGSDISPYMGRTEPTLYLLGKGYLEATLPPELNQLGTHLYLQLWVFPSTALQNYPTLIGNNYRQSFWLGLKSQAGAYCPRFWLNGNNPVESRTTLAVNRWSHVAVRYDGETIQFFVNGLPAGSHNVQRGRVNPNQNNKLYIGGDVQPEGNYPFIGYLADVQIWRGVYPEPTSENLNFLAGWALNGNTTELKSRSATPMIGTGRYEREHPQRSDRQVLVLDGNTYLEIRDRPALVAPKNQLTIQAWIKPDAGQTLATLIGNNQTRSYWLGLRADGAAYRLILRINGQNYESSRSVRAGQWTHITVSWDGQQVVFYINGKQTGKVEARFAQIRANPAQIVCVGADSGSSAERLVNSYQGRLADIHIWASTPSAPSPVLLLDKERTRSRQLETETFQKKYGELRAAWLFDGSWAEIKTGKQLLTFVGVGNTAQGHPLDAQRSVLRLTGANCLEIRNQPPEFYNFGNQLTLKAWVNPDLPSATASTTMTVLSGDRETSFALGLRWVAPGYRLWLAINGRMVETTDSIPPQTWSLICATYNGQRITLRATSANGQALIQERVFPATLNLIGRNTNRIMRIGAEVDAASWPLVNPYRGRLADLEIWSRLPEDPEDATNPMPDDVSDLLPLADYVAPHMPDGMYQFWIQGIDIFGRVSNRSNPFRITLRNREKPPAPGGAKAIFVPVQGVIRTVALPTRVISVEFDNGTSGTSSPALPSLAHYDLEIIRPRPHKPYESEPPPGASYVDTEAFEVLSATENTISLQSPPFAQLREDDVGKQFTIAYDYHLQVSWTWTGTQRLFSPQVNRFKIHQKLSAQEAWPSDTSIVQDFTVPNDLIEQDPMAGALAISSVDHTEWERLQGNNPKQGDIPAQKGIRWLPEPRISNGGETQKRSPRALLWQVFLPVTTALVSHRNRLQVKESNDENLEFNIATFVPGALVAYNEASGVQEWQHYPVLWHEWNERTGWTLYIVQEQPGSQKISDTDTPSSPPTPAPEPLRPQLRFARYYPGQRYVADINLNTLPDFGHGRTAVGTVAYHIGVSAIATLHGETLESEIGVPASVVAVDRRRPPFPPQPRVEIARADYYGNSQAMVTWDGIGAKVSYQLYRAVDSAIATRDLEQRRLSQTRVPKLQQRNPGYLGMPPKEVFAPDPDEWAFEEWLRAKFNPEQFTDETRQSQFRRLLDNWQQALFVDKPPSLGKNEPLTPAHEAWQLATEVWQAWAERFYPALRDDEFVAIAETQGNETAFSLVNEKPIEDMTLARDLEHRRLRTGHYQGFTPEQVFADNPGFLTWLRNTFPDVASNWQTILFASRSNATVWEQATKVWQAWSERFYAELTDEQFKQFVEKEDSDKKRYNENRYIDTVNGTVSNRYLYRLRSQSASLMQSTAWGQVSEPKAAPKTRPPRAPVFTKIEAGDRQITLHWALNQEPDLQEYRLYRSRNRDDLEDLRWGPEPIATLPDPRLKIANNKITLPEPLYIVEILGVYRTREFDYSQEHIEEQPFTFNYFISSSYYSRRDHEIEGLSRLSEGTQVVLVYRGNRNRIHMTDFPVDTLSYSDLKVFGLQNYFYCLVAVDNNRNVSLSSNIITTRAVDSHIPEPPVWKQLKWVVLRNEDGIEEEWPSNGIIEPEKQPVLCLKWSSDEGLGTNFVVTRRIRGEAIWRTIASSENYRNISPQEYLFYDTDVSPQFNYSYRIRVISSVGISSIAFREIESSRPRLMEEL